MIRTLLIDDEQHCTDRLDHLLKSHCNESIQIVGYCDSIEMAQKSISDLEPQLIFLDIQLGKKSGFDLLRSLDQIDFETIFITGYDQFAVEAFRFSAFDYLLKPVVPADLIKSVKKLQDKLSSKERSKKMETLFYNLQQQNSRLKRISLPTSKGLLFVDVKDIVRCEAEINYTKIFLNDHTKITVAKTLKEFENLFSDSDFFRVHNSHLINLAFIKRYEKGKGGTITLADNTQIEVSVRRKEQFLKKISAF